MILDQDYSCCLGRLMQVSTAGVTATLMLATMTTAVDRSNIPGGAQQESVHPQHHYNTSTAHESVQAEAYPRQAQENRHVPGTSVNAQTRRLEGTAANEETALHTSEVLERRSGTTNRSDTCQDHKSGSKDSEKQTGATNKGPRREETVRPEHQQALVRILFSPRYVVSAGHTHDQSICDFSLF